MEKAKTAQRAQREAEEAEGRRAAEAAAAAEEAERSERLISSKRASLPSEPAVDDPMATTVLVRLPDGRRLSRRRATSNQSGAASVPLQPYLRSQKQ
jgi:hypothetical protein